MNKINGRLIIVDPSLRDNRGHHYSITRHIALCAIEQGIPVTVFANKNIALGVEINGAVIRPVFDLTTYDYYYRGLSANSRIPLRERLQRYAVTVLPVVVRKYLKKIIYRTYLLISKTAISGMLNVENAPKSFDKEMIEAFLSESVGSEDHVLIHTTDALLYRAILNLLMNAYPLGEYPRFHLCTPYDMKIMPHSKSGISINRIVSYLHIMDMLNRNVYLYAENELLASELSSCWGVNVRVLQPPVNIDSDALSASSYDENVVTIAYLGAARDEKGFNLLPGIIEKISGHTIGGHKLNFIIQCNPQVLGYSSKVRRSIKKLEGISDEFLKLITRQQSIVEYNRLLKQSDIILMCYDQDNYRVRGSGIAIEAVAHAKNIIATPGTYPEWLAGEAGLSATNIDEVITAIMNIVANRKYYRAKALERAKWLQSRYSPEIYIDTILESEQRTASTTVNHASGNKGRLLDICSNTGRAPDNQGDANNLDDIYEENRYNRPLLNAEMSEDGKPLFVKRFY